MRKPSAERLFFPEVVDRFYFVKTRDKRHHRRLNEAAIIDQPTNKGDLLMTGQTFLIQTPPPVRGLTV